MAISSSINDDSKEQTIRSLVAGCLKAQEDIRAQLEKSFDRNPTDTTQNKPSLWRPNVLDEIIASLKHLNETQRDTIQFLAECVNPKL